MKLKFLLAFSPLILIGLIGCGDSDSANSGAAAPAQDTAMDISADSVSVVEGVTVVEMTGNDQMKYNLEAFTVPAGGEVKLVFRNVGKMPKAAMGHNVVFLTREADPNGFAAAAASARDSDYIPTSLEDQIFAATKLLGPGETDTIEFTAPTEAGDYVFLCSFPAHLFAGMRGVMTVE